eukprot:scaffold129733_cov69-Phaeocystis_antarctica.AAC.7
MNGTVCAYVSWSWGAVEMGLERRALVSPYTQQFLHTPAHPFTSWHSNPVSAPTEGPGGARGRQPWLDEGMCVLLIGRERRHFLLAIGAEVLSVEHAPAPKPWAAEDRLGDDRHPACMQALVHVLPVGLAEHR